MKLGEQTARHLRELYQGGNATGVSLDQHLQDVTWTEATARVGDFHSLAELVFHINYYVEAVLQVVQGGPLEASDKYSYDLQPVAGQQDWEQLCSRARTSMLQLAGEVQAMPDNWFGEDFADGKYGNHFRNLHGLIEHCHYHLGQIVLLKKWLRSGRREDTGAGGSP